jgi:5-methylcytosine-specific restriction protein A
MPRRPPTPCTHPGCSAYATEAGRCEQHKRKQASNWGKWQKEKGTKHERGYGRKWIELRRYILIRDDHLCQECLRGGKHKQADQVDHIINKADGGTDSEDNLQSLCARCHARKTAREGARGAHRKARP